jgi:2-polyprenyl-3-methyl-5-hydroxy-6-metoxy-1,4-benzoquinol methylase
MGEAEHLGREILVRAGRGGDYSDRRMTSFTENDIRPLDLVAGKKAAFEKDVAWFVSKRHLFEPSACPACGARSGKLRWTKFTLTYLACDSCGTIYMSPRPVQRELDAFYAQSEGYKYWTEVIFPASEDVRRERIFRPRFARILELCTRFGVAPTVLLEVGAGFGTFCQVAVQDGSFKRVIAVEPTPSLAAACRARGLEVIEAPIELVRLDTLQADVIASFEVLEHLLDPGTFVRRCGEALRPGGLIVLSCPNGRGFDVEVLGPVSDTVDIEHLNYFTPASLSMLVRKHGFEVLEVSTPGVLDADIVRNKVEAGEFDLSGQPFLERVLIEDWDTLGDTFQRYLQENKLSSHMWMVARKP